MQFSNLTFTSDSELSKFLGTFGKQQEPAKLTRKLRFKFPNSSDTKESKNSIKHKTSLITTTNFLLILIASAPPNVQRRNDIRQIWSVDNAMKPRRKTAFLVAQSRVQNVSDSLLKKRTPSETWCERITTTTNGTKPSRYNWALNGLPGIASSPSF